MLQASVATSCICVMQDGMDQQKFKCPRVKQQVSHSKLWDKLFRPRLHVAGTWLHGYRLFFSIADEDLRKDSVSQMEQLMRAMSTFHAERGYLPFGLSVHADNTYRESKNRFFTSLLILLVALRVHRWVILSWLRVGHSHEDLDQVFAIQASLIARSTFEFLEALLELMDSMSRPENVAEVERKKRKVVDASSVPFHAYKLDQCAEWQSWVAMLGVRLKGLRS